jgi:3-oxoacyl-[acyl-carrier-protein] synthase III
MDAERRAPRNVALAGFGVFLPERRVPSEELDILFGTPTGWVERATGVRERRWVGDETAEQMAACAARRALAAADVDPDDVGLVIAAAASPRQLIPCTAVFVQRELGLREGGSGCFDVDATCLSWLVALDLAALLVDAGRHRAVLVVTCEMASCSLNPREPESAGLFGDAAVATVVTRSRGAASVVGCPRFETHSSGADFAEFIGAGTRHHPNHSATRAEMNMFHMQGKALVKMARRIVPPFLDRYFAATGSSRCDYRVVVPHQSSRLGVSALTEHFGFAPAQVVSNLATRGNCIAASLPLAFAEAVEAGRIARGDRVLLVGSGAGVTLGAMDLVY